MSDLATVLLYSGVVAGALFALFRAYTRPNGPNPFAKDSRRPPADFVADHRKRDAVIKQRYQSKKVPEGLDAIVIGSGIGGLSTAAILAKSGKKVLVLEQHDQAGGCCHTFYEKGFEFDTGIHYIGEMRYNSLTKFYLDQISNGQIVWSPLEDDFDNVALGDPSAPRLYRIMSGRDKFKAELERSFPKEKEAIAKYLKLLDNAKRSMPGFLLLKVLPVVAAKFLTHTGLYDRLFGQFFKYTSLSAADAIRSTGASDELRSVLEYNFGDYGTMPADAPWIMHATLVNHFMEGVAYPRGGASDIAFHIIPVIEAAGGKVLVHARVKEIIMHAGRAVGVRMEKDDTVITAPSIISDAGIYNTLNTLLPKGVPEQTGLSRYLSHVRPGVGAVSVYIGLKGSNRANKLRATNLWAFSDKNTDPLCRAYLAREGAACGDDDVPLLFISFPSCKDPTWDDRFPGKSTCEIISFANWDWFSEWVDDRVMHRGDEYNRRKMDLGTRMWEQVKKLYPHLKDAEVEYFDVGSPITNRYYINAAHGEMYGVDHDRKRFTRSAAVDLRPDTPIPGLYLTGQDIFLCGFSGALFGGFLAAAKVLNRNLLSDLQTLKKEVKKNK